MSERRERLATVTALVPCGSRVADVGSGRGTLPRLLTRTGRASWCVATERSPRLVGQLRPFAVRDPAARRIDLRCGDGLRPLEAADRIEVLTITGLGARSIASILDSGLSRLGVRRLVLQPQTEWPHLRSWLAHRGWGIVEERLAIERGRSYLVLAAEAGAPLGLADHPVLAPAELLEAGPRLVRSSDPAVRRYWIERLAAAEALLGGLPAGPGRTRWRARRDLACRVLASLPA